MFHVLIEFLFWTSLSFILLAWSGSNVLVKEVINMRPYGLLFSSALIGVIAILVSTKYNIVYIAGSVWMINLYCRTSTVIDSILNPTVPDEFVKAALGVCFICGILLAF